MDSNLPSPPHDDSDAKNVFRKPSADATGRNYRRRSPAGESPPPDGSPKHEHSSSPNPLRDDSIRVSDHHSKKYDGREPDLQYGKNYHGRSSDSFRQSSRSSYGHSRNDKYADEDRYHERISSRSGHEPRGNHTREESDIRSKDYQRTSEKYSRDKYDRSDYKSKEKDGETYLEHQKNKDKDSSYDRSGSSRRHAPYDDLEREKRTRDRDRQDEKRDHRRSFGDHRSDRARLKESYKNEQKELGDQNLPWEEKRKYNDAEIGKDKDQSTIKVGGRFSNEDRESSGKKTKLFVVDKDENHDERRTSKFSHESKADSKASKTSGFDVGNDLDAAKVAAMKAAELVNKNLVGVGGLTTDQKKKLLWGKKSITTEESGHRWDTALFTDRERQEKFNKLMSLRLYWCLWQIVGCERRSQSGAEFGQPKCREAEGTTPGGSRETVHCRPSATRWPNSWIRSLSIHLEKLESYVLEYTSLMLRRSLSVVCFSHFMYALMLSLGTWMEFFVRQGCVISMGFIISEFVVLYNSYLTPFGNLAFILEILLTGLIYVAKIHYRFNYSIGIIVSNVGSVV
ncbi:PREDICTED: zinc finger CCCH domain-containing protein 13 isoform X2 [Lupinus angustifolius]|uniref:zinc finger CCCH domain-containing protein 13 isoform X2 n=1 Tax=Lupinus angustifolius TaxID=3871 RepID=UPI00092E3A90|nr:PREDICTED: zinc finger CCCH domain-containing protein 13 isoform X2 [Lupinus angustifolius]